ncbi:MAG TPA: ABC transporter permease, partial [Calditrichae bacterium]|nr:ABC transporter permease [Calditrichia bacterium]
MKFLLTLLEVNMGKIKTIVKKEIKLKVMTKGFLIGTLLGPIIILLFSFGPAFFIALSEKKPVNLVVVENTGRLQSEFQKVFSDTLENGMPRFRITFMDSLTFQQKQNELFDQLEKGKLKAVVVIPSTIFSSGKAIYYSKSASDIDFISNLKERLSNVVNREKMRQAGVDPLLVERLSTPVKLETRKVQKGSVQKSNVGQVWAMAFVFTMMLYMTSIFYGNAVMRGVLEEKTSRIVEILLSSINAFQLMLGKIIGIGLVGLIQYLFWGLMGIVGFVLVSVSKPEFVKYLQVQP